jgi:transposase
MAAFIAGNPLGLGLDLATERHAVVLAAKDRTPIKRFMSPHSREGVLALLARAEEIRVEGGLDRLLVFMEPTSYVWENVTRVLEERGVDFRLVSTLAVARQREIEHLTYAKGDYRDAELILGLGINGQWLERNPLAEQQPWRTLRVLANEHEVLLKAQVRDRQRIRSLLAHAFPEFLEVFKNPLGAKARQLLRSLARPAECIPSAFPQLLDRLKNLKGCRTVKLARLVALLEHAPPFGVESALAPGLARVAQAIDRFDLLEHQRAAVCAQLVEAYKTTPYWKVLDTIPGVSSESHALLLGFIGDPKRFDRNTALVKFVGIEPRENHSGMGSGSHSISKRGNSRLRHLVHRVAIGFISGNSEFAAYINRLRKREKDPLIWRKAIVAAENKYLRVVHTLCVRNKVYCASRLGTKSP